MLARCTVNGASRYTLQKQAAMALVRVRVQVREATAPCRRLFWRRSKSRVVGSTADQVMGIEPVSPQLL
jgi:hypothetical protein